MGKGQKVAIIGAGNVGSTVAFILAMNGSCHEIVLRDSKIDISKGKALDMIQSAAAARSHTIVRVALEPEDLSDCDIVVVTAGSPRLPGMSRDDLLFKNAEISKSIAKDIKKYSPEAKIIMVSNPLDAMTYVVLKAGGFDKSQVMGMAGILDSARMASFVQEKLGYGAGQIRASVMGGHGDDMVPLPRYSTVAGVPLNDVLTNEEIDEIVDRTKYAGAEIVKYLQKGSAYYAPAKSTAVMVDAILRDTKQIHSCAVYLEGEYGFSDIVNGVPIQIGAGGVEKILEVSLNYDEKQKLAVSMNSVKTLIDKLHEKNFFEE
jgi:malate dehydrogenase